MDIEFWHHQPQRTYDRVCRVDNYLFLAGEDSKDRTTQEVQGNDVTEQTKILFHNLEETLSAFGSSLDHIIKITTYLTNRKDRNAFSEARAKIMKHTPPSTLIMGVQLAEPEMLVEIDAIAVIPDNDTKIVQK